MSNLPPREIILAKAGELFHRRGYGSVTLDEIIAASGLPKSAFHQAFSSKAKLGCFWLERLTKRMTIMHKGLLDRPGDKDRRLRKYFLSMSSWVETSGFRSCQFANTAAAVSAEEEDLLLLIDQYKREQRAFFIDLAKTLVPESDARRIGTVIFLLYSGGMTEAQNLKATWPLEDALAAAEQLCGIVK